MMDFALKLVFFVTISTGIKFSWSKPQLPVWRFPHDDEFDPLPLTGIVQIDDVINKVTLVVEEYYVHPKNILGITTSAGTLMIRSGGKTIRYHYRPEKNLAFEISDNDVHSLKGCTGKTLNDYIDISKTIYWHWKTPYGNGKNNFVIGPSGLLMYLTQLPNDNKKSKWEYIDDYKIDGENCKHFQIEIGGLTIDYFVSDYQGKSMMREASGVPVRLLIKGTMSSDSIWWPAATKAEVNLVYDFAPQYTTIQDSAVKLLRIPIGYGCPGISGVKPTSYIQTNYDVWGDVVELHSNNDMSNFRYESVSWFRIINDHENNYFTIMCPKYNNGKYSDYTWQTTETKYGFMYRWYNGTCKIEKNEELGYSIPLITGDEIKVPDSDNFLNFNGYNYLGTDTVRDIDVNVFEKKTTNVQMVFSSSLIQYSAAIITFYESQKGVEFANYVSSQVFSPMRLQIRLFVPGKREADRLLQINYNHFQSYGIQSTPNGYHMYCKSNSYHDGDVIEIQYKGTVDHHLLNHMKALQSAVKNVVISATDFNLFLLRIRWVDIRMLQDGFLANFYLMERPSSLYDFEGKIKNKTFSDLTDVTVNNFALSEEECARYCLAADKLCTMYSYCNFACKMYHGKVDSAKLKTSSSQESCVVTKRVWNTYKSGSDEPMPFNSDIISDLQTSMDGSSDQSALTINLYSPDKYTFHAVKMTINPGKSGLVSNRREFTFDDSLKGYYITGPGSVSEVVTTKYTEYEQCSESCITEGNFYCSSFSVCFGDTPKCAYSSVHAHDLEENKAKYLTKKERCYVYKRFYSNQYSRTEGIVLQSPGFKKMKVKDLEDCAQACSTNKDAAHTCESFEYCPHNSNECILHSKHALDVDTTKDIKHNNACGHYSRIYRFDFTPHKKRVMSSSLITDELKNVSTSECARICALSKTCHSFDFCRSNTMTVCSFSSSDTKDPNMKLTVNQACTHYDYMISEKKSVAHSSAVKGVKKLKSGHSSGTAAGVAIAMLIVGVILSGIFIYGYRFYKHK